jgi:hypothetical protein
MTYGKASIRRLAAGIESRTFTAGPPVFHRLYRFDWPTMDSSENEGKRVKNRVFYQNETGSHSPLIAQGFSET